ncbi:MAG: nucleotidyltransferase [Bacteroidetes bacterium]|nr:nucleotidyltransferase [Bacteroidota bacterium]
MNIIIPMAGMGKRMRPHTLTIPKPLIPVAGKPIVHHLCEDLASSTIDKINEIVFIIGPNFGKEAEDSLLKIASDLGAKGKICYQHEPLGTAHAIIQAGESLTGHCIVAFADTLFVADFKLDESKDGIIWVNHVKNPEQFGVIKTGPNGEITDFVEKPKDFVSDLAIIGIYYFKDGDNLRKELQYLIDNDIKEKGEYQLTNALENMKNKGLTFAPAEVKEWLDCGNYQSTVFTNQRVLENKKDKLTIPPSAVVTNSVIIQPCFIGEGVQIKDSVVGPHVSIGEHSNVQSSMIKNTIIQDHTKVRQANIHHSLIGNHAEFVGHAEEISLGDYSIKC